MLIPRCQWFMWFMMCSYVFKKAKRVAGEPFDAEEDMNNVEVTLMDYEDDDEEGEESEDEGDDEENEEEDDNDEENVNEEEDDEEYECESSENE